MRKIGICVIISLMCLGKLKSQEFVDIQCTNLKHRSSQLNSDVCSVADIILTEDTLEIEFSGVQSEADSIESLFIHSSIVNFVPGELFDVFPKLEILDISHCEVNDNVIDDILLVEASFLVKLELKFNEINEVTEDAFIELIDLESLSLSSNNLETLPANIFQYNTKLRKIDLDGNKLKVLSIDLFYNTINLESLNLRRNSIQVIDQHLFSELEQLKSLFLSDNILETLPSDIFENNLNLVTIDLDGNHIRKLDPTTFEPLKKLAKLNLRDNVCINQQYGFDIYIARAIKDLQACFKNQRFVITTRRKFRRILQK